MEERGTLLVENDIHEEIRGCDGHNDTERLKNWAESYDAESDADRLNDIERRLDEIEDVIEGARY